MAKFSLVCYVFLITPSLFFRNIEVATQCTTGVVTFCQTCSSYALCPSAGSTVAPQIFPCAAGTVCDESSGIAVCTDPANAVSCRCTSNSPSPTYQCDPFDDSYRFACVNGDIQAIEQCVSPQICSNGVCGTTPQTTAPPISLTTCSAANLVPTMFNCTAYYLCSAGAQPSIISCDRGQIFSETVNDCIDYDTFDCSDVNGQTGAFGDPFTCGVFYVCSGGAGAPSSCPPGEIFNQTVSLCTVPDTSCINNTCTPCTREYNVFPISTTSCESSYQQCMVNSTDGSYFLQNQTCPNGFCFDPATYFCRPISLKRSLKFNHKRGNTKSRLV